MAINGKLFVVVCSLTTIASFVLSSYLLTTVNPPPLKELVAKAPKGTQSLFELKSADKPTNPKESLAPFYRFAPASLSGAHRRDADYDNSIYVLPIAIVRNVVPPLTPPPLYPVKRTTQKLTEDTLAERILLETNITDGTVVSDPLSPAKGLRRSIDSVENNMTNENLGGVVLEIMDKDGQARIEIKINTDEFLETDKNTTEMSSKLMMRVQRKNNSLEDVKLNHHTKIKILPNDTVVIENNNNSVVKKTTETYGLVEKKVKGETMSNTTIENEMNHSLTAVNNSKIEHNIKVNDTTVNSLFKKENVKHTKVKGRANTNSDLKNLIAKNIVNISDTENKRIIQIKQNKINVDFNYTKNEDIVKNELDPGTSFKSNGTEIIPEKNKTKIIESKNKVSFSDSNNKTEPVDSDTRRIE